MAFQFFQSFFFVSFTLRFVSNDGIQLILYGFRPFFHELLIQNDFLGRENFKGIHLLYASLGLRIEGSYGVDLVSEELYSIGKHTIRWKNIENPPS